MAGRIETDIVGDLEETVRRLLGEPNRVGPNGEFPPRGQEYDLDGLRLHVDIERGHVYRLTLTSVGYRPDWKLWNR